MARTKQVYKTFVEKETMVLGKLDTEGSVSLTLEEKNDAADVLDRWDAAYKWEVWNTLSKRGQRHLSWLAHACLSEDGWADFENATRILAMKIALHEKAEEVLAEELGALDARERAVRDAENEMATLRHVNGEMAAKIVMLTDRLARAEADASYWHGTADDVAYARNQLTTELAEIKAAIALIGKLAWSE